MRDSFVFYRSFWEMFEMLEDPKEWRELLRATCEYCLDGIQPEFENKKLNMAFIHFRMSCDRAAERYEKAIENGKKGGRPSLQDGFVPPDVWIPEVLKQNSVPKAAEKLGVSRRALYYWVRNSNDKRLEQFKGVQKRKNLNISESISSSDAVAESDEEYNKREKNRADAPSAQNASAPRSEYLGMDADYWKRSEDPDPPKTPEQLKAEQEAKEAKKREEWETRCHVPPELKGKFENDKAYYTYQKKQAIAAFERRMSDNS